MRRSVLCWFLACSLLLLFTGNTATATPEQRLVGTWQTSSFDDHMMSLVVSKVRVDFKANHHFRVTFHMRDGSSSTQTGTWRTSGNELLITVKPHKQVNRRMKYRFDTYGHLVLKGREVNVRMRRLRSSR